jgi:hypothetical protein
VDARFSHDNAKTVLSWLLHSSFTRPSHELLPIAEVPLRSGRAALFWQMGSKNGWVKKSSKKTMVPRVFPTLQLPFFDHSIF